MAFCTVSLSADKVKVEARLFSAQERDFIVRHYREKEVDQQTYEQYHDGGKKDKKKDKALPPGLQKKAERGGQLPPGWQKKLQRGTVIDHDVFVHCEPLPTRLSAQLPVGPAGTITVHVDGRIVRLLEATREIVDILEL
jgi:hypothetical protein